MRQHLNCSSHRIRVSYIKRIILSSLIIFTLPAFAQVNNHNTLEDITNDLSVTNINASSTFLKENEFDSKLLIGNNSNKNEAIILNESIVGNINKLVEKFEIPNPKNLKESSSTFFSEVMKKTSKIVLNALNLIGVRYKWGGNSPQNGLDCSGFVQYVFHNSLKINLPRRAVEMSRLGEKITLSDLKASDLVFFNTRHSPFSHVGIYVGMNKFVHAPSTGNTIRVDDIQNPYWMARFNGARRLSVITNFKSYQMIS